jgi:hypothetical protein
MSFDEPVYVCINSSKEFRDEQAVSGQLWIQGNRHLTTFTTVPEGMADTTDSVLLAATAEAMVWTHASQPPDEPKKGERIIVFPKELSQLEDFLSTCDPDVDPEDGHPIAYAKILEESQKFEITPRLIKEDSEAVANDPILSANVSEWMSAAQQVTTGSRKRVLEDGRDVENSEDEDDEDMKPDELHEMYTSEMDPEAGPKKLTAAEAAYQRMAGKAMKQFPPSKPEPTSEPVAPRSDSPIEPWMNEKERRIAETAARKLAENPVIIPKAPPRSSSSPSINAPPKKSVEPTIQAPAKAPPLDIKPTSKSKAAASPRASADQPTGAKAPTRKKGQESPETKVSSPPMATRRRTKQDDGSRAGGFRGVAGSGRTEIGVDPVGPPSKT